jgi:hypothetical protein
VLKQGEQLEVLNDWIARSRVFAMSDDPEVAALHTAAIVELEALKAFSEAGKEIPGTADRRMVFAYVDQYDKVHAFAGAMVRAVPDKNVNLQPNLRVTSVVVHPAELNNEDSTTWLQLKQGLELLVWTIDMTLDNTPISEDPVPVCMRMSRARADQATRDPELAKARASTVPRDWTRWATRGRDLDAAVAAEDYARAARIKAEFDALTEEDHLMLNSFAAAVGAAVDEEDWETAAELKAALDAALREGAT